MKKNLFIIVVTFSMIPLPGVAVLYEGIEAKQCFHKYNSPKQQENCLSEAKKNSEKKLNAQITETVKRIKSNNIGQFNGNEEANETYGDVYSRRFLKAQKIWQQYRRELCLAVASELNEDAYDYQLFIDQCEINLNRRHIEEIKLMGLRPVS